LNCGVVSVTVSQEDPMTRQSSDYYPLDYTKGSGDVAKDRVRDMADKATDQLRTATDSAHEIAGRVTEQAREYGEKAQEALKEVKPFVEKSLKEQPIATLAGVAIIGFVLGALWKR
jgi:ElaB/YqjD/DUF883 family membrane-anchored ribosome-binding protein